MDLTYMHYADARSVEEWARDEWGGFFSALTDEQQVDVDEWLDYAPISLHPSNVENVIEEARRFLDEQKEEGRSYGK